jgi:uncharacterized SAM-binding protein YcdF (DUF218 family)
MTRLARLFFLPPGIFLDLMVIALLLRNRRPRLFMALLLLDMFLISLLSLPWTANLLESSLDRYPKLTPAQARRCAAEAIVVLGAGGLMHQDELGQPGVSEIALERCYYATHLQRQTNLPVLFVGARIADFSEVVCMSSASRAMGMPLAAIWTDEGSLNTRQNAQRAQAVLRPKGIKKILLVTHYWHMPRAVLSFTETGLEAVPAPYRAGYPSPLDINWLPSNTGLFRSSKALEEYLGLLFYRLTTSRRP